MLLKNIALIFVVDEMTGTNLFETLEENKKEESLNNCIAYHMIEIDLDKHVAYEDGLELDLTATEFDLMNLLVERQGALVTFDEALEVVWHDFCHLNKKQVSNCVSRIKGKLSDTQIENVKGCGYRLV